MPTLAVLITYYNEGPLLTECLDSLGAGGTWPNEILIHDDCSTNPPQKFIPAGCPVRVIRSEKNVGPAAGRNKLIAATVCDFLHFHDSDDLFEPQWLNRVQASLSEEVDCVFTEINSVHWDGKKFENILVLRELSERSSNDDLVRYCLRHMMLVPSGTHRTAKIRAIGGYRTSLWQSEDFDFHIRLTCSGVRFKVLQDALVLIRVRKESRSQDLAACFVDAIKATRLLKGEIPARFSPNLADAAARFGSVLYQQGFWNEAREGFKAASEIGRAEMEFASRSYRFLARLGGQELAERIGRIYRRLLPRRLRALVHQPSADSEKKAA